MKITEVIYFSHELDMLEAHLEESQHYTQRIIIKESPCWFSGVEKPMYFIDNQDRFSRFKNLEVMVIPPEEYQLNIPASIPPEDFKYWYDVRRSNRVRSRTYRWDTIRDGADYVLSMDCDEIIRASSFHHIEKSMQSKEFEHIAIKLEQMVFFMNLLGSIRTLYRCFRGDVPHRPNFKGHPRYLVEERVGWHFNNCFKSEEDLRDKAIGILTHLGYSGVEDIEPAYVMKERLLRGETPFRNNLLEGLHSVSYKTLSEVDGGRLPEGKVVPKSEGLDWCPRWIQEHPDKFPWIEDVLGDGPFPDGISRAWGSFIDS